jgi:hypothetical protein
MAHPGSIGCRYCRSYGKIAMLRRETMIWCLFRHTASQLVRDLAVRAGTRIIIQTITLKSMQKLLRKNWYGGFDTTRDTHPVSGNFLFSGPSAAALMPLMTLMKLERPPMPTSENCPNLESSPFFYYLAPSLTKSNPWKYYEGH